MWEDIKPYPASIEELQNGALFNSHFTKELERKQTFKRWCAKSTFFYCHSCPKRQSTKESQQWNRAPEKRALTILETLAWRSPTFWRKFQKFRNCCPSVTEQAAGLRPRLWRFLLCSWRAGWCHGTNTAAPAAARGTRVCVTACGQTAQWTQNWFHMTWKNQLNIHLWGYNDK